MCGSARCGGFVCATNCSKKDGLRHRSRNYYTPPRYGQSIQVSAGTLLLLFCPQSTTTILPGVTTMALPDISNLHINGNGYPTTRTTNAAGIPIPQDIEDTRGDQYMEKLKQYAKSVPFSIEPYSQMLELLDFFLLRLTQSVEAKDFDIGFLQWDSMLT